MRRFVRLSLVALVGAIVFLPKSRVGAASPVLETFEGASNSWQVTAESSGGGAQVAQSAAHVSTGAFAVRTATSGSGSRAQIRSNFSDAAGSHSWQERPGTWVWQRASIYVPATTVAKLGSSEYLTIAGFWPSSPNTYGWFLRVKQGGALYAVGHQDFDNGRVEFNVQVAIPQDRWFTLEVGLHTQHGPGVKRAFAFLIDGRFYGWYHQGRMQGETYDRVAMGVLDTNSPDPLEVFLDDWGTLGQSRPGEPNDFPTGPDVRAVANVREQDYRTSGGLMWQIDWTTWSNDLRLDPVRGLYSNTHRVQSGRNMDKVPDLTSGWAEIEVDWPKGTPPRQPNGYFGPMVGFRKEINREQNLEVIPLANGGGQVDLVLEAWDGIGPHILERWPMPSASIGGTEIPEPGDIIRVRWEQVTTVGLAVRASYYDASAGTWHPNVIDSTYNVGNIGGVNFNDGFHKASSVTIDTPFYSIRRFKFGALVSYPATMPSCTYSIAPNSQAFGISGGNGSVTVTATPGCVWTATSNAAWISMTSGSTGTGNGSVGYTVSANTSAPRTGTLTIAGKVLTVSQAGTCSYSIAPNSQAFGISGGNGSVTVTATPGCVWTATSNAAWISMTSGSTGTGNGSVGYTVSANASAARTGTLTVAGKVLTVSQAGTTSCSYSISPTYQLFGSSGGNGSFGVTTSAGCAWQAVSQTPWIAVTSGGSGKVGKGTVTYSVQANPTTNQRGGTIQVAGQSFGVGQAAK